MKNRVLVLMSTYNGEKYICEQLFSLYNQRNVELDILIRDDGSNDKTIELIEQEQKNHPNITILKEENLGYAKSFWSLITVAKDNYDYYAFCDQDDIWLSDKLIAGIKKIEEIKEDIPILYTSKVISIDSNMNILSNNTFTTNRILNKYESFQKSVVPGCTFIFNKKAIKYLKMYNGYMESHDWASYCIINVFGKVIYDNNSYIYYRIHENNTIGKNSKIKNFTNKVKRLLKKSECSRSKFAKDFYETYYKNIVDITLKNSLNQLAYYKYSKKLKIKLLFNIKFKGFIFKIYVFLNKI